MRRIVKTVEMVERVDRIVRDAAVLTIAYKRDYDDDVCG